ncbi:MAG TPA: protein-glutamate O-methyltransferase CheR [Myxococcota bacterium]|nr:protein-glutamate O-methyltransferase CheR [Myxococcota bacterium]
MKARTSPELSNDEFELLRRLVEERTGILVSERKSYLIASRFASLLEEEGVDTFAELYTRARAAAPDGPLMDRIVDAITTNETLWFRDDGPWHILRTALLPRYCAELSQGRRNRVRIWSAACSTGQEPYSVAMTIREFIQDEGLVSVKPEAFEIVATDISPQALEIARRGTYDQMAASRGLPPQYAERFFESSGSTIEVVPAIKSMVRFQRFNLQQSFALLGRFDLILCRNVLIYFSNELKLEIFRKIASALCPEGALILGGSESAQGATRLFQMVRSGRHLYYTARLEQER